MKTKIFVFIITLLSINIFSQNDNIKAIEGKLDQAKIRVDKEIEDPQLNNKAETWYIRAYVYNEIAKSQVYGNLEKFPEEKTIQATKKCKELDLDNSFYSKIISVLLELGPSIYNKGITHYNNAVQTKDVNLYKTALYYFDKFYEVTEILGKDDKKFIDQFIKYNGINPSKTYIYSGYAAQQTGDFEKAHKYYNTIIKLNETNENEKLNSFPLVYFYETELLIQEKKLNEAKAVVDKGIQIWTDNTDLQISAINLYKDLNDDDKLSEIMEDIIKNNPNDVSLLYTLARTYNNLSKKFANNGYRGAADTYKENAINAYKKAILQNPKNSETLFRLNYNLGIIYFNDAAKLYNEQKGSIDDYQNLLKSAMPYLEKAKSINTNTSIDKMLFKIYTVLEMPEKAKTVEQ